VAHREGAGLTFLHGPEVIARIAGPLRGDLEWDHRAIRAACDAWAGPLSFGLFARTEPLRALLRDPTPGAWSQSLALRAVVLDPWPAWAGLMVGADAVRLLARNVRDLAALFEAAVPLGAVRAVAERFGVSDLRGVFGFEPLEALSAVLRRSASDTDDDEDAERGL
jgi:hypothetical protein